MAAQAHFAEEYLNRFNMILHKVLHPTWFYKQELLEVPGILTALFVTYDGVKDDRREIRKECTWDEFMKRVNACDPDWDVDVDFLKDGG